MRFDDVSMRAYRDGLSAQQLLACGGADVAEHHAHRLGVAALVEFKAKFESRSSHFSFKRPDPGAFNVGSIGSTCTFLPRAPARPGSRA